MRRTVRIRTILRTAGGLLLVGAVALGAAGVAGPPLARTAAGAADDVPAEDAAAAAAAVGGPSATAPPGPTAAGRADPPRFTTTAPRGAVDRDRWPTVVRIGALDVAAPVGPVGLDDGGSLVIPSSPQDVGWYQGGAVPGEPGVALLTSHLDTRREGRGVFAGLVTLDEGDVILIDRADGTTQRWAVTGRTRHRKDDLPDALSARSGPPRLALVTCGGPFDAVARRYRDNFIVWADLLPASTTRPEVEE